MAILCTQRSCASHVEMFQYASAKNMDKWDIFQHAHYKIENKLTFIFICSMQFLIVGW